MGTTAISTIAGDLMKHTKTHEVHTRHTEHQVYPPGFPPESTLPCSLRCPMDTPRINFDIAYEWDVRTGKMEWYGDIAARLGSPYPPETRKSWFKIIHASDRRHVCTKISSNIKKHIPYFEAYRLVHAQGYALPVIDFGTAVHNDDNKPLKWIGLLAFTDICADNKKSATGATPKNPPADK
jgi:hypothetical protein